mmetsp:Transcript_65187/g.103784  ORF Transcript_65187/g.103784 Transcript_65187/m.103784 type:complete len:203 (-) Transcript_65187:815-1423(-)
MLSAVDSRVQMSLGFLFASSFFSASSLFGCIMNQMTVDFIQLTLFIFLVQLPCLCILNLVSVMIFSFAHWRTLVYFPSLLQSQQRSTLVLLCRSIIKMYTLRKKQQRVSANLLYLALNVRVYHMIIIGIHFSQIDALQILAKVFLMRLRFQRSDAFSVHSINQCREYLCAHHKLLPKLLGVILDDRCFGCCDPIQIILHQMK